MRSRRQERDLHDHYGSQLARRRQVHGEVADAPAQAVSADRVVFSLPDPRRALRRVALLHELVRPRDVEFERRDGGFELELPRPPVDRLEYLLAVEDRDGDTQVGPDPANPLQADGPFGPKSVVEFPEYAPPGWLADEGSAAGELREVELPGRFGMTGARLVGRRHRPGRAAAAAARPRRARVRGVLLAAPPARPPRRVRGGAAVPRGAAAAAGQPERDLLRLRAATRARSSASGCPRSRPYTGRPVGLGASLGALAWLHAHWTLPGHPRRPLSPVGQLLPAPPRRPGGRLRRASRASPASCRACSAAVARSSGSR